MTTEEENELTRLRRENEDLKLLHEANLLMIDMARAFRHRYKKTTRRCYPAGA